MKRVFFTKYLIYSFIVFTLSLYPSEHGLSAKKESNNKIDNPVLVRSSSDKTANTLLKKITEINSKSPSSLSLSFVIVGSIKNKKFKTIGNIKYIKKSRKFNATFYDYIFKSPITLIFQDGFDLRFYFPVDKKLVIDDTRTINMANYLDMNIGFDIIYKLLSGNIPLIDNYKIRDDLSTKKGNRYLILENREYFETVSFRKDIPDKILIIRKDTKEKFEIHLKRLFRKRGSQFYRSIRIIAKRSSISLNLGFSRIRLNVPVRVRPVKRLRLPRNVEIIRM